ncbi:hypothetical protein KJ865_06065, partial [Myxococcota bacterium]|nr:hypothetical protein [Myxococcota bacterium]
LSRSQVESAATALHSFLVSVPESPWAMANLLRIHLDTESWSEAADLIPKLLKHTKTPKLMSLLWQYQGLTWERTDQPVENCIDAYSRAVQFFDGNGVAWGRLAHLFHEEHQLKNAQKAYLKCIELSTSSPMECSLYHSGLALLYEKDFNDPRKARDHFETGAALVPHEMEQTAKLTDFYVRTRDISRRNITLDRMLLEERQQIAPENAAQTITRISHLLFFRQEETASAFMAGAAMEMGVSPDSLPLVPTNKPYDLDGFPQTAFGSYPFPPQATNAILTIFSVMRDSIPRVLGPHLVETTLPETARVLSPSPALSRAAKAHAFTGTFAQWDMPRIVVLPATQPVLLIPAGDHTSLDADAWQTLLSGPLSLYTRGLSLISIFSDQDLGCFLEALKTHFSPGHAPNFADPASIERFIPWARSLTSGNEELLRRTVIETPEISPEYVASLKQAMDCASDRISLLQGGHFKPITWLHTLPGSTSAREVDLLTFIASRDHLDFLRQQT